MIPTNEQGVIVLFSRFADELGYKFKEIGTRCPDAIMTKDGKDVRIEFEFKSKNFKAHKHNPKDVDLIVCWEDDWEQSPVPVLSLERYIALAKPAPKESVFDKFIGWLQNRRILAIESNIAANIARKKGKLYCSVCGEQARVKCEYRLYDDNKEYNIRTHYGNLKYICSSCGNIDMEEINYREVMCMKGDTDE